MIETLTQTPSISEEINLFTHHIDSLRETLPMTMILIQDVGKSFYKKLEEFEKNNCTTTEEGEMRKVLIPIEHARKWKKIRSRHDKAQLAQKLVPRSIMVSLVSQYDAFIGRLLRAILIARPELLNPSEKTFSYSQVASFQSIESIREHVIEKEVETVLRSSHADQIKWMETRFSVPLTKGLAIWPQFIELTERRNLFAHANGVVSNHYISTCNQCGFILDPKIKEGSNLEVTQKYFIQCCACISELGVKLAHVLWRKLLPDQRKEADNNLISTTYELIEQDDYPLAISLLDFACDTIKSHTDEWTKVALVINRAQAYKWSGNEDECKRILGEIDWTAKGDEFKLADIVLRDEWSKAKEIMRRIGSSGPVTKLQYRDWPLFRKFREREEFLDIYREIFSEEFPKTMTSEGNPPFSQ
jgi:hypothetical protein